MKDRELTPKDEIVIARIKQLLKEVPPQANLESMIFMVVGILISDLDDRVEAIEKRWSVN